MAIGAAADLAASSAQRNVVVVPIGVSPRLLARRRSGLRPTDVGLSRHAALLLVPGPATIALALIVRR